MAIRRNYSNLVKKRATIATLPWFHQVIETMKQKLVNYKVCFAYDISGNKDVVRFHYYKDKFLPCCSCCRRRHYYFTTRKCALVIVYIHFFLTIVRFPKAYIFSDKKLREVILVYEVVNVHNKLFSSYKRYELGSRFYRKINIQKQFSKTGRKKSIHKAKFFIPKKKERIFQNSAILYREAKIYFRKLSTRSK